MIRLLSAADIPAAMRLKEAAGWNQTEQDWRHVMRLAPEGCWGMDCDGQLAATTTAVDFGGALAWIGMVLTHPDFRGRGFARALMEHALENLRGVSWIKLDATDMGRPLYLRLGFRDESPVERWAGVGGGQARGLPIGPAPLDLDRAATGAGRAALLDLLGPAMLVDGGYAMGRAGSKAAYFGPCVCRRAEAARLLLCEFLARHPGQPVYWDLLPHAAPLAREFGFQPLRRLSRMALPGSQPLHHDDALVYAIAGFEYG